MYLFLAMSLVSNNFFAAWPCGAPAVVPTTTNERNPVFIFVPVPYPMQPMNFNNHVNQSQNTRTDQNATLTDTCKSYAKQASDFITCNTKSLLFVSAVALCASTLYVAVKGNTYLKNNALWSHWRADLTLEHLITVPQHDLAKELHLSIYTRFANTSVPAFNSPQEAFLAEIDQELAHLRYYHTFYSWCAWAHCARFLPIEKKSFEELPERIQRAAYLKNVFSTHKQAVL